MRTLIFSLIVLIFCLSEDALALDTFITDRERITNYDSQIVVNSDSSLTVTENIRVYSAGEKIKRGIYRDFPTDYRDNKGLRHNTTFEILQVLRDGSADKYHTEKRSNGTRLYIGDADTFLSQGYYIYTIKYRTRNQLGFFHDHDEIYYNVTGNGWEFEIENVTATVTLPEGVAEDTLQVEAYTGTSAATGGNFISKKGTLNGRAYVQFESTSPLNIGEGLTLVAGWPKGFVEEPSRVQNLLSVLIANALPALGLLVLAATAIYYFIVWMRYGRDPEGTGFIVTRFDIRKDISPAGARYINRMGSDHKTMASSIINMAVNGFLKIKEENGEFTVTSTGENRSNLYTEEKVLSESMFTPDSSSFTFDDSKSVKINSIISKFNQVLKNNYQNRYFKNNYKYLTLPIVTSLVYTVLVFSSMGSIVFEDGILPISVIVAIGLMHIISAGAMKARTKQGREIQDQILGLKNYLTAVENPRYKSSINYEIPDTLKVYEKYLPYAVALDVEPIWTSRFKEQIDEAMKVGGGKQGYYSGFYSGKALPGSFGNSLSKAISSSSTPPGSSSGFSGGSSGGGGGGGGGGGW